MSEEKRDWTQLPPDLLQEIDGHLLEISDQLRFRFVCVRWRSFPTCSSKTPIPKLPWLLLLSSETHNQRPWCNYNEDGQLCFLSLSKNTTYTIPFPEFRNHQILTSTGYGWLIAISHKFVETSVVFFVSLVNPITRSTISLPPLSLPRVKKMMSFLLQNSVVKLLDLGSNHHVVLFANKMWPRVFLCRPGETAWRRTEIRKINCWYVDSLVYKGRAFVFNRSDCTTEIYDLSSYELVSEIPPVTDPSNSVYFNLVESPMGELFLVLRKYFRDEFQVFQLDESVQELPKWEKVDSIGDCFLFETPWLAMCFSSRDLQGFKENCIYYLNNLLTLPPNKEEEVESNVWLFDIGEGRIERALLFPDGRRRCLTFGKLFIPSL